MSSPSVSSSSGERRLALLGVNTLSLLSQIVQIGTITPLLSLALERRNVSAWMIGIVVGASWLAILISYRYVPTIIKRYGLVKSCLASALLSAAAITLMSLAENLVAIFFLNLIVGFSLIIRWIACDTWIVLISDPGGRGRAIGIHETLMGLGIAVGPMIISFFGIEGLLPYLTCASLLVVSGMISTGLFQYDSRPDTPAADDRTAFWMSIPVALTGAFIAGFAETANSSFLAPYAIFSGYALTTSALFLSAFGAGGTFLQLPIGWLADRISYKGAHLFCAALVVSMSLSLFFIESSFTVSFLITFILGGAVGGMNTLAVIQAGKTVPDSHISTAMTAIALMYTLGGVVGPIVTGTIVSSYSPHGLIYSSVAVAGLFLFAFSLMRRRKI